MSILSGGHMEAAYNNKLGGEEEIIQFTLPPTDGTTGPQWIKRLEEKRFNLADWTKSVLNSSYFVPTSGVINEIVVLKGMLWNNDERIIQNICAEANKRVFIEPNAETACLIREMFIDEEIEAMGLMRIVTMHKPIKDCDGALRQLDANCDAGGRRLGVSYIYPERGWRRGDGFAYASQSIRS